EQRHRLAYEHLDWWRRHSGHGKRAALDVRGDVDSDNPSNVIDEVTRLRHDADGHARGPPRPTVHPFHSRWAYGDALTISLRFTRGRLQDLGFHSEIYVQEVAPKLAGEIR